MTRVMTVAARLSFLIAAFLLPNFAAAEGLRPMPRATSVEVSASGQAIVSTKSAKTPALRPVARPSELGVKRPSKLRPVPRLSAMGAVIDGELTFVASQPDAFYRPSPRKGSLPRTRWEHKSGHAVWTRAALSALKHHGKPLISMVPKDINHWCPAYAENGAEGRSAFWVGFMSALAKHESTYRADAVGGGGLWYGLLQIYPDTARRYGCRARTGEDLKNGAANLSCAVRIMAVTVKRDNKVGQGGRGGVAADWGPMVNAKKRADIAAWTRTQNYCVPQVLKRPKARPQLG